MRRILVPSLAALSLGLTLFGSAASAQDATEAAPEGPTAAEHENHSVGVGAYDCSDACVELFGERCNRAFCREICQPHPEHCSWIACEDGEIDCHGQCVLPEDAEAHGC